MRQYYDQQGFTLTELCVVLGILTILFAIVLPVYQNAIAIAQSTQCKANLRVLGQAFHLYAQDYPGLFPHSDKDSDSNRNYCWYFLLDQYLDASHLPDIKQCPSAIHDESSFEQHSLKMNAGLCPKERPYETSDDQRRSHWYWPRLWDIPKKANTVLLVDGRMDPYYDIRTDTHARHGFQDVSNRHSGGSNILNVAGNVTFIDADQLEISLGEIGWSSPGNCIWQPYRP